MKHTRTSSPCFPAGHSLLTGCTALAVISLGLTGCFGSSSSSSSDPTEGTVSLTEEEQVLGAALIGIEQAGAAGGFAEGIADVPEEPTGNEAGTTSQTFSPMSSDEVEVVFSCPHPDADEQFGGSGAIRMEEGAIIDRQGIEFPEAHFSGNFPEDGTAKDFLSRSNCVVTQDGEAVYRFEGSFDIAQEEDIHGQTDHRAVFARIGGFTGAGSDDAPDLEEFAKVAVVFDGELRTSRYRALIHTCEGCVGGDLTNFNGDPVLDTTSHSFMEMEMNQPGMNASFQVGESPESLFAMIVSDAGNGSANVFLDGLLKWHDGETGCGFDVTYATNTDLMIENYHSDTPDTVGGELQVTLNESGNTYDVQYHSDGTVTVRDESGANVTPQPTEDAMKCGFFAGEPGSGGSEPTELEGLWVSDHCEEIGQDESVLAMYEFHNNGLVDFEVAFFENSSCSDVPENTMEAQWEYVLGDAVAQGDNRGDAVEIDFINGEGKNGTPDPDDIFDVIRIEAGQLYFGAPHPLQGANDPGSRPTVINTTWTYSSQ